MFLGASRAKLELCSYRITGARCTMLHVPRKSTRRLRVLQQLQSRHCHISVDFKVELLAVLVWLREIAKFSSTSRNRKINTRKIVGIPKSQNFVLANNSNNKVIHTMGLLSPFEPCKVGYRKKRIDGNFDHVHVLCNSLVVGTSDQNFFSSSSFFLKVFEKENLEKKNF